MAVGSGWDAPQQGRPSQGTPATEGVKNHSYVLNSIYPCCPLYHFQVLDPGPPRINWRAKN